MQLRAEGICCRTIALYSGCTYKYGALTVWLFGTLGQLRLPCLENYTSQDIYGVTLLNISNKESQYRDDYVTKKLYNVLVTKYFPIEKNEMGTACGTCWRQMRCIQDFDRQNGRRPLETSRQIYEDCIKIDLQEVEWGGIDWIDVAVDRDRWQALVISAVSLQVT